MKTYDIHHKPPMKEKFRVRPLHMQFTAIQVDHDFWLDSPLGNIRGYAGDYIIMSNNGFMVIERENQFEQNFQIVK